MYNAKSSKFRLIKINLCFVYKVQCNSLNKVSVWAANDEVFHVEVETPIVIEDPQQKDFPCYWEMPGKTVLSSFDADHTQFSPSWMKKEFIEKVKKSNAKLYR